MSKVTYHKCDFCGIRQETQPNAHPQGWREGRLTINNGMEAHEVDIKFAMCPECAPKYRLHKGNRYTWQLKKLIKSVMEVFC